jgi:hypothetical protein
MIVVESGVGRMEGGRRQVSPIDPSEPKESRSYDFEYVFLFECFRASLVTAHVDKSRIIG